MGRRFRGFSADWSTGIDLVDCRMYGGNPGWEDGKKGVAAFAEAVVQEREDSMGERGDGLAWGGEEEERWG